MHGRERKLQICTRKRIEPCVMLHQTVNGPECLKQMSIADDYPDIIIGCAWDGSNFAGICLPFVRDKINGKDIDIIGVEPISCPTMTRGPFEYDSGDTAQMTPLLPMHTLIMELTACEQYCS